jgi:hypothetical protein
MSEYKPKKDDQRAGDDLVKKGKTGDSPNLSYWEHASLPTRRCKGERRLSVARPR